MSKTPVRDRLNRGLGGADRRKIREAIPRFFVEEGLDPKDAHVDGDFVDCFITFMSKTHSEWDGMPDAHEILTSPAVEQLVKTIHNARRDGCSALYNRISKIRGPGKKDETVSEEVEDPQIKERPDPNPVSKKRTTAQAELAEEFEPELELPRKMAKMGTANHADMQVQTPGQPIHFENEEFVLVQEWQKCHRLWKEIQEKKVELNKLHDQWLELSRNF